MTISELVANTLIGVDTCAISTDADAPTIHPLQLIQEANDYPAKETRKRNFTAPSLHGPLPLQYL